MLDTHDLSFPDADGAQLLGFKRLMLNFDISSVWKIGASFADVELDQPYVRVMLRQDGTLNLADLARYKDADQPAPDEDESPVGVFIDRLSVATGRVAFEDRARATPFATELRPITFELRDFSTGGETGNAYSLHGASVVGEKNSPGVATSRSKPLTSTGKFEVTALKATTIWSYLREGLPFEFTKGTLDLNGEYFYTASKDRWPQVQRTQGRRHRLRHAATRQGIRLRRDRLAGARGNRDCDTHQQGEHRTRATRWWRRARGA